MNEEITMKLRAKLKLCLNILRFKPCNLYDHALQELPSAGDDEMQAMMNRGLLDLVAVFSTQGHSGFSAGYAKNALDKLLSFKPLGPLTGEESEWGEDFDGNGTRQNKRCGRVFMDADGQAYDIDGKVFVEPNGVSFTSGDSRVPVTFPYTPTTEYVDVPYPQEEEDK